MHCHQIRRRVIVRIPIKVMHVIPIRHRLLTAPTDPLLLRVRLLAQLPPPRRGPTMPRPARRLAVTLKLQLVRLAARRARDRVLLTAPHDARQLHSAWRHTTECPSATKAVESPATPTSGANSSYASWNRRATCTSGGSGGVHSPQAVPYSDQQCGARQLTPCESDIRTTCSRRPSRSSSPSRRTHRP